MKAFVFLVLCCAFGSAALRGQAVAPELLRPENRTVSNSKQFTIFGGTRSERSDLVRRAEDLKKNLLRELQAVDTWKTPVLIVLTPGDGVRFRQPAILLQVFDAEEAGRKIQLDLAPGTLADRTAVDRGILRALLLEMALRNQKFEKGRFIEPPDWLAAAISVSGSEPGERASLYASLMGGKGVPEFDKFLRQSASSLRGRAQDLHAAQSLALFNGLADLSNGRQRIVDHLTMAEPARDPWHRFAQTWPELANDPQKLARLWGLAMAKLSSPTKLEFLSAEETGRKLAGILKNLEVPGTESGSADALQTLSRTKDGQFRLARAAEETQRLVFRAHPLYAALVGEYRTMLDELARKRRWGFAKKFQQAEETRLALDERATEITDYMNWFQANHVEETVPTTVVQRLGAPDPPAGRNDKISRYLDSVEKRGW